MEIMASILWKVQNHEKPKMIKNDQKWSKMIKTDPENDHILINNYLIRRGKPDIGEIDDPYL